MKQRVWVLCLAIFLLLPLVLPLTGCKSKEAELQSIQQTAETGWAQQEQIAQRLQAAKELQEKKEQQRQYDLNLDNWLGGYRFEETDEQGWENYYELYIYKEGDSYYGEIGANGLVFDVHCRSRAKAKDTKEGVWLQFFFEKYYEKTEGTPNAQWKEGDLLIGLLRQEDGLYTDWRNVWVAEGAEGRSKNGVCLQKVAEEDLKWVGPIHSARAFEENSGNLDSWLGYYGFLETVEGGDYHTWCSHALHIYEKDGRYYGNFTVGARMYWMECSTFATGDENKITFRFLNLAEDYMHIEGLKQRGDILLELERSQGGIITHWVTSKPLWDAYDNGKVNGAYVKDPYKEETKN